MAIRFRQSGVSAVEVNGVSAASVWVNRVKVLGNSDSGSGGGGGESTPSCVYTARLLEAGTYQVTGESSGGVRISRVGSESPTAAQLAAGLLHTFPAGAYFAGDIPGGGVLAVWGSGTVRACVTAASPVSLSADDPVVRTTLSIPYTGEEGKSGSSYPMLTVTGGTCPADVTELYLTPAAGGGAEGWRQSAIPCGQGVVGAAKVYGPQGVWGDYVVWGYSAQTEGSIQLEYTLSAPDTCLTGDTLITLADGGEIRLDALRPGDLVLGGDGRPARVRAVEHGSVDGWRTVYRFAGGYTVHEVHEHRFYNATRGYWMKLKDWRAGDCALALDGSRRPLLSVQVVCEPAERYSPRIEGGSYWAQGLLCGECACNLPLLLRRSPRTGAAILADGARAAWARLKRRMRRWRSER